MKRSIPIGRYHLLDRVSSGGMADVFRAKVVDADGTERLVAMKRILEQYAEDPAFVRMLVAEYRLSLLLVHPNIARIYELLQTDEGYFISMEYVDGKDLRATMYRASDRRRPVDPTDAAYLMARAVDGLEHAHVATTHDGQPLRLVHRDFSPSNILVSYDGSVKIIDFGIAKADVDRERTAQGIIKGKVRYMSPEQAQGDPRLTGQSDVFSAGSVLYELLTGTPAFTAPSEVELIYAVRRAEPVPLRELAPHVPEGLAEVVEKAMARSRRDRYQTAGEFRDALVTFLRGYAPNYRRTRLANYMRSLWAREIDVEIRTLLEYALSEEPAAASVDLLASASLEESVLEVSRALDVGSIPGIADAPAVPSLPSGTPIAVRPDDLFAAELNAPSLPPDDHRS
ncbi:MAG: serine/threonine protein kinase [Deltaproteobacteria bacterium]|nr:serine/threonine protein kinase [Deltaproteobacteria bacterium]MBP6835251.1 serine/threonine protein kinase [Deltaproteobacteria bacterium]